MKKHLLPLLSGFLCAACFAAVEVESGKIDPATAALVKHPEASGGAAIRLTAPDGVKLPVADIQKLPGPAVKIQLSVDKRGMYAPTLRAFPVNDGGDSVWCTVDGGEPIPFWFRVKDHGKWVEHPASRQIALDPGKHELAFYVRENGILLDTADLVYKGEIKRYTIHLNGKSPYRFKVPYGGEYQLRSTCASESRDEHLYGTFTFDGKTPYRRVVFPAAARKVRMASLMHISLTPGEHTLEVQLPDNVTLQKLVLLPVDRNIPAPPQMLAYKPPFNPVKGEHPRLLMRKSDLPRIRANFNTPENAPVWELVRKRAKQNRPMPIRDGQVYHETSYLTALKAKAFIYAVEGDETAGREAVRAITEYLAKIDFDNKLDVTRKIGHTIYSTALIYDWCYPLLTKTDKTVLRQTMLRIGRDQEIGWPPLRQTVINGHGNESQLSRDFLAMAIAVYDEDPDPWKICMYRILEEMVPAHNYEYPSGRHTQGSNYGPCRFRWDLHAMLTLERLSGKRIFNKDIEKVPYFWINLMLPNQELFDDTDVWIPQGQVFRYPETFFNMYVAAGDPLLKGEFLRQGGASWAQTDPIFFLLFNRPEITPDADFAKLPLTWQAGEPLPSLIARSSWLFGKKSPSAVVEMKGAMYHRSDHQHMDAGAFQVYFRAPLLVDIGQYGHWGGHYDFHFAKRTIPHNSMLFYDPEEKFAGPGNDGGQRFVRVMPSTIKQVLDHPEIHRTGKTLAVAIGPDRQRPLYSHLKSDLAAAYSPHKLAAYTRSFVYANTGNPDKPAILMVFDRTRTTKPEFQKYFLLNSPVKPVIDGNVFTYRNRLKDGPEGVAVVTSLLPEKQTAECRSDGKAMKFFREKVEPPQKNRHLSKGSRTMISPASPALEDEFLHVIEVGTPEAVRTTAQMERNGNRLYVTAANWFVSFAQAPDDQAAFRVKDARNVLLTDLKPGMYTVAKNGKAWQSFEVKAGEGTLFFPAEPGDYRVSPGVHAPKGDYSSLKAAVPIQQAQVRLDGKILPITPVKQIAAQYWPVDQACRAFGGEAKISGSRAVLKLPAGTFTVQAGRAEVKDGKFTIRLMDKAKILNGKPALSDESLAALAGYALRRDGDNAVLQKLPADIIGVSVSSAGDGSMFAPLVPASDTDYWGAAGTSHFYTVSFSKEITLDGMDIAWFRGASRRAKFAVETSLDGVKFTPVWKGESSGKTDQLEPVKFAPVRCRALRLRLAGNSDNEWNSIRRMQFRKAPAIRTVPQTFYLSPAGSDNADGSAAKPWKTIARANKEVVPGDTVQCLPGSYTGPIKPARSGKPGKPITYLGGPNVRFTGSANGWCIDLANLEYIVVDGFTAVNTGSCRWLKVKNGRHLIFRNLNFSGSTGSCPIQCYGIEYSLFDNILAERTLSAGQNGLVSGDMWNNGGAFHNVFQNIRVSRAGHRPFGIMEGSADNVVRDSVFDGRYGRNFEMFFPARTLMERCTLTNAYNGAGSADPRAKWFVSDSIFRYNVITRNNGVPLVANSYYDRWHKLQLGITGSRMYNNTFYMNDSGAWDISEDNWRKDKERYYINDNVYCNNIFFDNDRAGAGVSIKITANLKPDGNLFRRNIIAGEKPGMTVVRRGWLAAGFLTLAEAEQQHPGMFRDNLDTDPKFVNGVNGDLRLSPGSPAIDAGDFLARTTADSKGKVISVTDAAMFYDGYGIPWEKGDLVMIGKDRQEARVVKSDRSKNTLVLDREVTVRKGDTVSLSYAGKAPDLGAYESGLAVSSGPEKLPDHHRQPGLDRPHGKPVIHCTFEPEDRENWFFWCKVNRSHHSWGWMEPREDKQGHCMTVVATPMTGTEINLKGFRIAVVQASRTEDKPVNGDLRIQFEPPQWELDVYPYLEFDYRLKPGTPWGVALDVFPTKNTKYTRVYLGGTENLVTGPAPNLKKFTMIADGKWHHLRVDVRAIREVLPDLRRSERLLFRCGNEKNLLHGTARSSAQAWLDNVRIVEK